MMVNACGRVGEMSMWDVSVFISDLRGCTSSAGFDKL